MESNPNPFATPSNVDAIPKVPSAISSEDVENMPNLPLDFRTAPETLSALIPIGLGSATITIILLLSVSPLGSDFFRTESWLSPILFAMLTGITAFGCLMAIRCRIFVDDASIVKTDYGREVVQFTQISSWRYNKRTGTVMLRLLDDNEELAVSNWAMSIDKSKLLAKVMKAKVGPPSE